MSPLLWITLARGLFALGLAAADLVAPDTVRPMLVNFVGVFFLAGGLAVLRWPDEGDRTLELAAAWAAVVAGAGILARFALMRAIPEAGAVSLLALALLVAGALHVTIANRWRARRGPARAWLNVCLGALELALGALLLAAPLERGAVFHALLAVWALTAGTLLLVQAWTLRAAKAR